MSDFCFFFSTFCYWLLAGLWMIFNSIPTYRFHDDGSRWKYPPEYTWFEAFGRATLAWVPVALTTYFIDQAGLVEWMRPVVFGCLSVGLLAGIVAGRRIERRWGQ